MTHERTITVTVAEISREHRTGNGNRCRLVTTTRGQEFRAVGKIPALLNERLVGQTVALTVRGHFVNAIAVPPQPKALSVPKSGSPATDEAQADMRAASVGQARTALPGGSVEGRG